MNLKIVADYKIKGMQFQVLNDIKAAGVKPETQEQIHALFQKGTTFEGELVQDQSGQGVTLFTDGAYWQFPVDQLIPVGQQMTTGPVQQNNPTDTVIPKPANTDGTSTNPLWKHPQMPNYLGATVGGLIGMKLGEKLPILPGVLNWIVWTGIGGYLGYIGTKKLISSVQQNNAK